MDPFIEATEVMARYPTRVGFTMLYDQHFEFRRVLTGVPFEPLEGGFNSFEDLGIAMGRLVVFFECCDEHAENGERFDFFVCIYVPYFRVATKLRSSQMSVEICQDGSEIHVLLCTECPGVGSAKWCVGSIKFFGFRDLEGFKHNSGNLNWWSGLNQLNRFDWLDLELSDTVTIELYDHKFVKQAVC